MIYTAIVINNTEFFNKGTIQVRIRWFYHQLMQWDLSKDTSKLVEGKYTDSTGENHKDFDAFLFAPFGGGQGYGALVIPQVNEKGVVFFPENDIYKNPIWMGSFFEPKYIPASKNVEYVNAPADNAEKDLINAVENGEPNLSEDTDVSKKNIIIRTKNTEYSETDGSKLDWSLLPTSNLISVDNKGIKLRHYNSITGWEDATANEYNEVNIIDDKIEIKYSKLDEEKSASISATKDGIEISTNSGENLITIDKDNNIIIKTPNKVIFEEASEIQFLGDGDKLVKYTDLYDILGIVAEHIHIAPNGKTDGPLTSNMAPLMSQIKTMLMNMQAEKLKTE